MANSSLGSYFSNVDQSQNPALAVAFLDKMSGDSRIKRLKQALHQLMNPQPGGRLLDAGCGTGLDVQDLARLVGPDGHVTGLDFSQSLIDEARRRAEGQELPVDFVQGDVTKLEFPADTFDACKADRVLMHVADPALAVRELARVTRPGGRVVVFDTDWDATTIDHPDRTLTRKIIHFYADVVIKSGWVGRQLPRLFRQAGLEIETLYAHTSLSTSATFEQANRVYNYEARTWAAVAAGVITEQERESWLDALMESVQNGDFLQTTTSFTICGVKPLN